MLIPDRTVPITLEILILCFSLLYLMVPNFYTKLFSYFHYKISIPVSYTHLDVYKRQYMYLMEP